MDFEEPNMEELIQNDLRSEMNKILSQSEVEAAVSQGHEEFNLLHSPFEPGTSRNLHHDYRAETAVKLECEHEDAEEPQLDHSGFGVLDSGSLQDMSQHRQIAGGHQEICGHFSVGSYADFQGEMGPYPPQVTQHNDLQSLTWLTTVDVQELQKLTEQGSSTMVDASQANQQALQGPAEHRSVIHMVPPSNMQLAAAGNEHKTQPVNLNSHPPASPPRFMPMQAHLSPESHRFMAQQRYHLHSHPGGGPMGRHLLEGGHAGPRRYFPMGHHNPYPPPPYTAGRSDFIHGDALMHSRYHHHHHAQQQKVYPKPVYSYSCLIAMALHNSKTGCLPVSEIYSFMMENYPYFKTAPDGWKNSVRHNLSLNKCFEKVEKPNGSQRKGCLWALNPAKIAKMKEEIQKWKRKDPDSIRRSMSNPEDLDRELEEMRRSDEEATRRRMLSLSSHGLTASSLHGHPHQLLQLPHHAPPCLLPMHHHAPATHGASTMPSPAAHPSTHQRLHFSTELAQQNFAMTLARSASQPPAPRVVPYDLSIHGGSSSQVSAASALPGSNNNNNAASTGIQQDMIVLTPGAGKSAFFASPHSVSSTSSNSTSLVDAFADCTPGGLRVEDDIDASLSDLAGLNYSFWDGPLDSRPGTSSDVCESFAESEAKSILPTEVGEDSPMVLSDGHVRLPPVIRMLSSTRSEQASPDTPDFKTSTASQMVVDNFGREMTHFSSNNIKPVVMS